MTDQKRRPAVENLGDGLHDARTFQIPLVDPSLPLPLLLHLWSTSTSTSSTESLPPLTSPFSLFLLLLLHLLFSSGFLNIRHVHLDGGLLRPRPPGLPPVHLHPHSSWWRLQGGVVELDFGLQVEAVVLRVEVLQVMQRLQRVLHGLVLHRLLLVLEVEVVEVVLLLLLQVVVVLLVVVVHDLLVHVQDELLGLVFEELLKLLGGLLVGHEPVLLGRVDTTVLIISLILQRRA
ncbi:hypothetical protein EYF80_044383 [Liparis tanakae]|uniref:Uncharacterized protein n=1 Tax=Liparis tanakae TaxID=230148 RepID=A0A4Z2FW35_9TELE|nr:hypothetical protein EYF80_044383 [Liparis tanakae]